jgi:hypothetical protein
VTTQTAEVNSAFRVARVSLDEEES